MAVNKKISELTELTIPTGVESLTYIPVAKSGANYKVSARYLTHGLAFSSPAAHGTTILTGNEQVPMTATSSEASVASRLPSSAFLYGENFLDNPGFQIYQRGTSFSGVATAAVQHLVDRWATYEGANGGDTYYSSRVVDSTGDIPNQIAWKIGRTAGATNTNALFISQSIENGRGAGLWGRPAVLSFYAKAGANFSAAGSTMIARISSGTGADQTWLPSGFTGDAQLVALPKTLTTSWQRFTISVSNMTAGRQFAVDFNYTPVGTAGADDALYLACIKLEAGEFATPFENRSFAVEQAICQRYYETNAPYASNPTAGNASVHNPISFAIAANTSRITDFFKVTKRTTAFTASYFRGSGAAGAGACNYYPAGGPWTNANLSAIAATQQEMTAQSDAVLGAGALAMFEYTWVASAVM